MPFCCVAFYRDGKRRLEGYHRYKTRLHNQQTHLGLELAIFAETDGENHPIQESCNDIHFVIFPIAGPHQTIFHEPDLIRHKVVPVTPADAWDVLYRHGEEGLKNLQPQHAEAQHA